MSTIPQTHYIYIVYDPSFISKRVYIGYSIEPDRRLYEHTHIKEENLIKDRWINKILARQINPAVCLFTSFPTEQLAGDAEIELIAFFKSIDIPLANIAPGGNKLHVKLVKIMVLQN